LTMIKAVVVEQPKDGNCLYSSLASHLENGLPNLRGDVARHLRCSVASYQALNPETKSFGQGSDDGLESETYAQRAQSEFGMELSAYCANMKATTTYGGTFEIDAFCNEHRARVIVYMKADGEDTYAPISRCEVQGFTFTAHLLFTPGKSASSGSKGSSRAGFTRCSLPTHRLITKPKASLSVMAS
jgi:hypothetical protein